MKVPNEQPRATGTRNFDGARHDRPTLITGGAGFIGCNVAHRLLSTGHRVIIYDNLSREGVERNADWLRTTHGDRVEVVIGDVRSSDALCPVVRRADRVFHFAAQVAVTTSLVDPVEDFEVNARGTLNLLEAIRTSAHKPPVVFTSTNKVYGGLEDVPLVRTGNGYAPRDTQLARTGVDEQRPLDFHSPYGCSKGTADQYMADYARSFGLRTAVFRMSCIYGPHQFGTEDQGWVAHFLIRALEGELIVLYGDGHQVRDILFIDDLVDALLLAQESIDSIAGQAFNIGGGPSNAVSLLGILDLVKRIHGVEPEIALDDWRTGDQRYYVSNTAKFAGVTGWRPAVDAPTGVQRLYDWLAEARRAQPRNYVRRSRVVPVVPAELSTAAEYTNGGGAA